MTQPGIDPKAIEAAKRLIEETPTKGAQDSRQLYGQRAVAVARALLEAEKELADTIALANRNMELATKEFLERCERAEKAEAEARQANSDAMQTARRLAEAEAECLEQARLNGMGASREAALMTRAEKAEAEAAHHWDMVKEVTAELEALRQAVQQALAEIAENQKYESHDFVTGSRIAASILSDLVAPHMGDT